MYLYTLYLGTFSLSYFSAYGIGKRKIHRQVDSLGDVCWYLPDNLGRISAATRKDMQTENSAVCNNCTYSDERTTGTTQAYCTGGRRSGEWLDLAANATGVVLAAFIGALFLSKKIHPKH